jgi:hypothetical protein
MTKKIYTINENGTLFDLNDLDPETFWKLCYHTHLFMKNHEREKSVALAQQDVNLATDKLVKKMTTDLKQYQQEAQVAVTPDPANMTEYEKLRIDALKSCTYSCYAEKKPDLCGGGGEQRSIYSDNFQYKWKESTKTDEIARKIPKIGGNDHERSEPHTPTHTPAHAPTPTPAHVPTPAPASASASAPAPASASAPTRIELTDREIDALNEGEEEVENTDVIHLDEIDEDELDTDDEDDDADEEDEDSEVDNTVSKVT